MSRRAAKFLRRIKPEVPSALSMLWGGVLPSSFLPAPSCVSYARPQNLHPLRGTQFAARTSSAVLDKPAVEHATATANGAGGALPASTSVSNSPELRASPSKPHSEHADQQLEHGQHVHGQRRRGTDLRKVRGIGPKYEALLVAKNLGSCESLRHVFVEKAKSDTNNMVAFLQDSVGIRHGGHCNKIVDHLREQLEKDQPTTLRPVQQQLTLCVEGNISTGKSSFLQMVGEMQNLQVVPEPVEQWQNVDGKGSNMLDAFYQDPQRFAYTFQNYVFVTRVMQERRSAPAPLHMQTNWRLMERSVFSDRMVFVKAVHESQWMSDLELSVYDSWFEPIVSAMPTIIPDGFIYLQADPETCMRRLIQRQRKEESQISLEYLMGLHNKHEEWLADPDTVARMAHTVPRTADRLLTGMPQYPAMRQPLTGAGDLPPGCPELPASIKGKVYLLSADRQPVMARALDGVPALVIDYDTDFDLKDREAKDSYAQQVGEYFKWVEGYRASRSQLLLPGDPAFRGGGPVDLEWAAELQRRFTDMPTNQQWDVVAKGMAGHMRC